MGYRVLTVNREFGSGGGRIAQSVAKWLGWKLLDREMIEAIAKAANMDPKVVKKYDEPVHSWLGRINHQAMRSASLAVGHQFEEDTVFNANSMADFSRRIVEDAYAKGNCVIVGRGAQCILQHKTDAYHAFVYAPFLERVKRLQGRLEKGANAEQRIRTTDQERAEYVMQRFGKNWNNPHLYNLMISSSENEGSTARVILYAMTGQL